MARCSAGCTRADEGERTAAQEFGHDLDRALTTTDLVPGENVLFAATRVTDGGLLRGRHDRSRSNLISHQPTSSGTRQSRTPLLPHDAEDPP